MTNSGNPALPFLTFGAPDLHQAEIDEVVDSLRSGWIGTGPKVARFEAAIAAYKGVPVSRVVALNSCTAALHVSMIAAGLGPGDEVITTALTFCATVNAIIHSGATPVLADVDPLTMNIDPASVEARITSRTRAIVPVHFAGRPCDMDAIMAIADRHGLKVIEDCAHAIETEYRGRKAGTLGDFGCFSFYVTKNVTTGEGGAVIARDPEAIGRIKVLSLHGMSRDAWRRFSDAGYKHYYVTEAGFKYNMMDLQAAIGIHQLRRVENSWKRRQEIWRRYRAELADLPIDLPAPEHQEDRHAYHLFPILIDKERTGLTRDAFLQAMTDAGIGVGVHYQSLAEHPYYRERFGWRPEEQPNAWRIGQQTVSIPLSAGLSDDEVLRIVGTVERLVGG